MEADLSSLVTNCLSSRIGTMDALLAESSGDPWNPRPDIVKHVSVTIFPINIVYFLANSLYRNVSLEIDHVVRVLRSVWHFYLHYFRFVFPAERHINYTYNQLKYTYKHILGQPHFRLPLLRRNEWTVKYDTFGKKLVF